MSKRATNYQNAANEVIGEMQIQEENLIEDGLPLRRMGNVNTNLNE